MDDRSKSVRRFMTDEQIDKIDENRDLLCEAANSLQSAINALDQADATFDRECLEDMIRSIEHVVEEYEDTLDAWYRGEPD